MTRITKREAIKRFEAGQTVILCPCKLRPGFPFSPHSIIHRDNWKYNTTWDYMYKYWSFYNCCWETGYYAHYYKD